jgi:hypothetical protein
LAYANATRNTQQGFFNQGFTGWCIHNNNNVTIYLNQIIIYKSVSLYQQDGFFNPDDPEA